MGEVTVESRDTASNARGGAAGEPIPGAILVYTGGRPTCIALRLPEGERVAIGRGSFGGALDDARTSRQHAFLTRTASGYVTEDNGSRNGTLVDAVRIAAPAHVGGGAVVRVGQSVLVVEDDVRRFETVQPFERGDVVVGPTLDAVHALVSGAASSGETVVFRGETGSGKELAAQVFHDSTGRSGPLVAVNCAAIPAGVAERLLFGAKRGAYSGADADAEGYLQAADRGTLFLDEIAELDLLVQAKLLRAIETQEIFAVGASRARRVDVRFCSATHKDLRREIADERFRQDLYFRIARAEVTIPPLRERREEIPWLACRALRGTGLQMHASFVEACLLRTWPGNVRELLAEVRGAGHAARGRDDGEVRGTDLSERAGRALEKSPSDEPLVVRTRDKAPADEQRLRRALEEHGGNVTAAARALGIHRNQLRRWIERKKVSGSARGES